MTPRSPLRAEPKSAASRLVCGDAHVEYSFAEQDYAHIPLPALGISPSMRRSFQRAPKLPRPQPYSPTAAATPSPRPELGMVEYDALGRGVQDPFFTSRFIPARVP